MFIENPKQQIMILAHNRNVLTYLHDAIAGRNIATVGYYVGGMKEKALKETESKQVVIATFSMAAEGLDIRSLTTLIMVTPKTDIEQSIGRILRERHSQPIVVDIVDTHDLFKNQWRKRKTFYKKANYKIIYTDSYSYTPDTNKWTTLFLKSSFPIQKKKNYLSSSEEEQDKEEEEEEEPDEPKDDLLRGKCLLKFNK
jgi:superfamily II DNA or RNA helicase